jgi:hypothetical protein
MARYKRSRDRTTFYTLSIFVLTLAVLSVLGYVAEPFTPKVAKPPPLFQGAHFYQMPRIIFSLVAADGRRPSGSVHASLELDRPEDAETMRRNEAKVTAAVKRYLTERPVAELRSRSIVGSVKSVAEKEAERAGRPGMVKSVRIREMLFQ